MAQLSLRVWGLGSDPPLGTCILLHMAGRGSLRAPEGSTAEKTSPQRASAYSALAYVVLINTRLAKAIHGVKSILHLEVYTEGI